MVNPSDAYSYIDLVTLDRDRFDDEDVPSEWIAGPDVYLGHMQQEVGSLTPVAEVVIVPDSSANNCLDPSDIRRLVARAAEFNLNFVPDPISQDGDCMDCITFRAEEPIYAGDRGTKGYSLKSWLAEEASRGSLVDARVA